jgi:hypothetical protein
MSTIKVLLVVAVNKPIAAVEPLDKPSFPENSIDSYRRSVKAAREVAEADLELKPKGAFRPFLEW